MKTAKLIHYNCISCNIFTIYNRTLLPDDVATETKKRKYYLHAESECLYH